MRDPISHRSYARSLGNSIIRCFPAGTRMHPREWAENIYRLPKGGKFSFSYCPYARQMFDSIFDPLLVELVFQLYSRGLKSTVILLAIGYWMDQLPKRILSLWPTNKHGEKFRKDNLNGELFDTTPPLHQYGSGGKQRTGSNTLSHINYPGGILDIFGANSPGDMRRAKGNVLYGEEIDAVKTEQTDEGDQFAIFRKRGDEYPDTIKLFASYPALKLLDHNGQPKPGHSRINTLLMQSDGNQWFSTCLKCGGEPFVMNTAMVVSDPGKAEKARLECPRCGAHLTDADRYRMAHGQGFDNWKPQREFRGLRGFHANAMLWPHPHDPEKQPGGALQMIAQQREDAANSDNPKRSIRVFVNTVDAEPFDPTDETEEPPNSEILFNRRENYTVVPQAASYLCGFADIQKDRIEVGWRAFGRNEESWGMDHQVIDGYVRDREVWCGLVRELGRVFPHESGASLTLGASFIDGGHYSEDVYRFFQYIRASLAPYNAVTNPLGHVALEFFRDIPQEIIRRVYGHCRASKGEGKHGFPVVEHKMTTVAKNLKGHKIGTWEVKDRIYARLRQEQAGANHLHFNQQYSQAYFQQLVVETVSIEYDGAEEIRKYENKEGARNEALDIEVGIYAAFNRRNHNFDKLEEQIRQEAEAAKLAKKLVPVQPTPIRHLPAPVQPQQPVRRRPLMHRLKVW